MFPPINTFSGFLIFAALCCVGGAGGLYVRSSKLSAHSYPLLNKSELVLFRQLRAVCNRIGDSGLSVMVQVSYGEFLSSSNKTLFFSFNCKRADFLIMDTMANPIAIIEYQGSGHYGFSLASRFKAMKSDRTKRKVLRRAGIPLLEVPAKYQVRDLEIFFSSLNQTRN